MPLDRKSNLVFGHKEWKSLLQKPQSILLLILLSPITLFVHGFYPQSPKSPLSMHIYQIIKEIHINFSSPSMSSNSILSIPYFIKIS